MKNSLKRSFWGKLCFFFGIYFSAISLLALDDSPEVRITGKNPSSGETQDGSGVSWDFGDGSKVVEGFVSIHLYTKPGEYNPTDTICKQNLVLQKKVSYSGSSCLGKEILCGFRIRK
ncbi:MAG: PKD domain-containing protein [Leptospiraceae bacterium]|nr:PKD domain-containing protein [Leptospiraceae bacterium]